MIAGISFLVFIVGLISAKLFYDPHSREVSALEALSFLLLVGGFLGFCYSLAVLMFRYMP
jgi:hypothetical protein